MSLLLPTWQNDLSVESAKLPDDILVPKELTPELIRQENLTRIFTARLHWELSTTITSNHLLAMVAMSNTLMSMQLATFIPEHERNKKHRHSTRPGAAGFTTEEHEELFTQQQAQIKQGWSLLSTHHCFLLPDKIDALGKHDSGMCRPVAQMANTLFSNGVAFCRVEPHNFKRPQVEMMARRWQHHCIEIREAAQQILLGELGRMGKKGRKQLVESWAQFLPLYTHTEPIVQHLPQSASQQSISGATAAQPQEPNVSAAALLAKCMHA